MWTSGLLQGQGRFTPPDPAGSKDLVDLAPILTGRPVSMVIKGERDGLYGLNLILVTYGRSNESSLITTIYELEPGQAWPRDKALARLIGQDRTPARLMEDWKRAHLLFPLQPWSKGRRYAVELSSAEADDKSCLGLAGVRSGEGRVFVGSQARAGSPAVQPVYKDRYPVPILVLHFIWLGLTGLLGLAAIRSLRADRPGPPPEPGPEKRPSPLLGPALWALLALYLYAALRVAWVGDDAYITFRTVANWAHGFGLTWNTAERVQAFTHPLWMLATAGLHQLTREFHLTSLGLSLACSLAAVLVVVLGVGRSRGGALAAMGVLAFSKAFIDYSTSGLENPLSHLLLALFLFLCFTSGPGRFGFSRLFLISLTTSLALLNRLDTALIYLPLLVWAFFRAEPRPRLKIGALAAGLGPLAAWEVFSLLYYGFPFPNTAYAKLGAGLEGWRLASQGAAYLGNLAIRDPISCLALASGLGLGLISGRTRERLLALGLVLYLAYVIKIGGDWMSGRFFAIMVLGGAAIVARQRWRPLQAVPVLILGLALTPAVFSPPLLSGLPWARNDPAQARDRIWNITDLRVLSLLDPFWRSGSHDPDWIEAKYRRARAWQEGDPIRFRGAIGHFGLRAGPGVFILDNHCLADPLRARLPARYDPNLFMGHLKRAVPAGYAESLLSGRNLIQDPDLARYYDRLGAIVRGPVWSWKRLGTIIGFNLGRFDHLIDRELYQGTRTYYVDANGWPLKSPPLPAGVVLE